MRSSSLMVGGALTLELRLKTLRNDASDSGLSLSSTGFRGTFNGYWKVLLFTVGRRFLKIYATQINTLITLINWWIGLTHFSTGRFSLNVSNNSSVRLVTCYTHRHLNTLMGNIFVSPKPLMLKISSSSPASVEASENCTKSEVGLTKAGPS